MKKEFSKRFDGRYNVWRLEPRYSEEEIAQLERLGMPKKSLYFWNLVAVAENHYQATQAIKKV